MLENFQKTILKNMIVFSTNTMATEGKNNQKTLFISCKFYRTQRNQFVLINCKREHKLFTPKF